MLSIRFTGDWRANRMEVESGTSRQPNYFRKNGNKKTPDFRNGKLAHQGWLLLCWITWNGNADFGSCLPVKETRLFLADVDYVSIGNANRARTITPSTVAVFLQINLWIVQAKSDGSEKPPLKIGVSNCLLYDGFFLLPSCGRLNYIWML